MKTTRLQLQLLKACRAQAQPSTVLIQNTVRSLVARGWLARHKWGGRVYVTLTAVGAANLEAELIREERRLRL